MKLLLSSNSTMPGEEYLGFPTPHIKSFLGDKPVKALFIPYAAVTFSFDEYEQKVNEAFQRVGHSVVGIHHFDNPVRAIEEAEAIVVGGGNTWQLVRMLHDQNLMMAIRRNVQSGTPYIGWSAGSNVACPTLRTTNDMPIIDPTSFNTTGLVPFQINPHYMDANPDGHAGETREQRIAEFIAINPLTYVVGLREGTLMKLENDTLELIGNRSARIFMQGMEAYELNPGDDFNFLLK
ncbi:dipeptidase PepE [Mangrovibacterium marinum]|uniref:dipeptidase E n=1 Tax=Mangrovibacterium marinum TaxID=1639118 RepID=A0A2T5C2K2_9BACT|nr:dipeptidase PepE [Mangrovibacterium marinum]PTN08951.1 dipeptidase E [Mangrovibacterium marinum]